MKLASIFTPALALAFTSVALAQTDDCATPTGLGAVGSYAFDTTSNTTSGFSGGGACVAGSTTINQDLFWVFTVPAAGDYDFDTFGSFYDTKLSVHSGFDCSATCLGYNDDTGGLQSQVRILGANAGDQLLVQVGGFGASFGAGTLNIAQFIDPCVAAIDDSLEDNDTCQTAVPLANGSYPGLFASVTDGDFYRINVLAGDILTVVCTDALTNNGDVNLRLYDNACNLLQTYFGDTLDYTNNGATANFIVEIFANPFSADTCTDYDMDISSAPDPCFTAADDSFEDNDDCGMEISLGDGTYPALWTSKTDWDYFSFFVADGDTLQLDTLGSLATGDVDIILYLDGFCEPFANGDVACNNSIACGYTTGDNEQIFWTNTTGAQARVIAKINVWPSSPGPNCGPYDLIVSGADGGGFSTNYCGPNTPNSTGLSGVIGVSGSNTVASNDLTVTGSDLPDGQFAYMIASRTQGFVANPGGSQGNLCILGNIARFNRPGEVGAISGGTFSLLLPLGDFPEPAGSVAVMAGDTWNFQCWHRDFVGGSPTSNFTDAIEVLFQ